jgi:ribosome recycling factor
MSYDFNTFKEKLSSVEEWLQKELSVIRTGRATPSVLDGISVESYGAKMPITQMATVTTEGARSLRIVPWDMAQAEPIQKEINAADLGLSVSIDDGGVRVSFPEVTGENREKLTKVVRAKLEEARITLRHEREKVWEDIQKEEKDGEMSEDEKFRAKDTMQKMVDEAGNSLEAISSKKEAELLE